MDCAGVGGSLFWETSAQQGLGAAKQGLGAARDRVFTKAAHQTLQDRTDKSVVGPGTNSS